MFVEGVPRADGRKWWAPSGEAPSGSHGHGGSGGLLDTSTSELVFGFTNRDDRSEQRRADTTGGPDSVEWTEEMLQAEPSETLRQTLNSFQSEEVSTEPRLRSARARQGWL
jgi:hypothetical protein